ncbi:TPA: LysM peptidoglycan-binding domain-containing protein [bacterium]|nr:LysM peptidoglycan-binding domain-containing protein [bacterium]
MYLCPIGTFAYTVKSGDTLYDIARRHNTSEDMIISYNPFIDPERLSIGQTVCVPLGDMSSDFDSSGSCRYVTVKPGDTLNEYAREFKTTVEAIIMANPGIIPNNLRIGQVVCIPLSRVDEEKNEVNEEDYRQNVITLPKCINVRVRDGDYPYVIAQRYKTTVEEILRVNPGIDPTKLRVGQTICVPVTQENYPILLEESRPETFACQFYTVKRGDTFRDLAKEFGVTINQILNANPGVEPTELKIGQVICIPRRITTVPSSTQSESTSSGIEYQDMEENRVTQTSTPLCINYTIKQGDTFRDLAKKFNTTINSIIMANPNVDPYNLQIGQVICIPQAQAMSCIYRTIRKGDTFAELARVYNVSVDAIINANPNLDPNNLAVGQVVCIPSLMQDLDKRQSGNCINHKVVQGDTLAKLARRYNTTVDALFLANPGVDPHNLKIGSTLCIPIVSEMMKTTLVNLNKRFRVLWGNHSIFDNLLIMSIIFDLPVLPAIEKRLLRNPSDFKEVLTPFYGETNAMRFANLLTNHINLGEDLFIALKRNDSENVNIVERNLMTNADEMARFLTSINPSWKKEDWNKMLTNHVRFSRQLAQHYLNGSYEDALRVMDEDYMNSLNLADKMSEGIINQFPKQF